MKRIATGVLALFLALGGSLTAADRQPGGVATLVQGEVTRFEGEKSSALKLGGAVYAGDRIKTGANGRAALVLADGTQVKLNFNTDLVLRDTDSKGAKSPRGIGSVKIFLGSVWGKITKKGSRFEFDTPSSVAAVKGSAGEVIVSPDGRTCYVWEEGVLHVFNDLGAVDMNPMTQMCMAKGFKPGKPTPLTQDQINTWHQGSATSGTLKVQVRDVDGTDKELILEYR